MAVYFYEFLVRGNPDGTVAWHVVQASDGTNAFGQPYHDERILSMAQAEDEGIALPSILAEVNRATMIELETARAALAASEEMRDENAALKAEIEQWKVAFRETVAASRPEPTTEDTVVQKSAWQKFVAFFS